MRRGLAAGLIVLGSLLVAYAAAVVLWRDPATGLYASWQQQQLDDALAAEFAEFQPAAVQSGHGAPASDAVEREAAGGCARSRSRSRARRAPSAQAASPRTGAGAHHHPEAGRQRGLRPRDALGRRISPAGPGHYRETELPGQGRTAAIAAHRTTFGAWFRDIDDLRRGDLVQLRLPYGTFRYRVFAHEIVDSDDWSIIRDRRFDTLVLSACHPLYSSAQRWVVYARLASVDPVRGASYTLTAGGAASVRRSA